MANPYMGVVIGSGFVFVMWSDPVREPVFKIWSDLDPVFNVWSDLDPVFKILSDLDPVFKIWSDLDPAFKILSEQDHPVFKTGSEPV